MSQRKTARLAWGLWLLTLLVCVLDLALATINDRSMFVSGVFGLLVHLTFITVGAIILSRRQGNLIGWVLIIGNLVDGTGELALDYAVYGLLTAPGSLPGAAWVAWFGSWARGFGYLFLIMYVLLLFPNGRLPSSRWRFGGWLVAIGLAFFTLSTALSPTLTDDRLAFVQNPLQMGISQDLGGLLDFISILLAVASMVVSVAAVIVRYRHARGDERQQIKWLAYAGAVGVCIVIGLMAAVLLNVNTGGAVGAFFFNLAVAGIPIAVGFAVLRYRLYDIDLIIRRTLVYAVLTALLALVYFVSVVLLQQILRAATGAGSDLAIVGATLLIAALFMPLRQRIQGTIDRRFYRSKYDTAHVLAAFGATVRDEVDLGNLREELLAVVEKTMRPVSVALWLKPANRPRPTSGGERPE